MVQKKKLRTAIDSDGWQWQHCIFFFDMCCHQKYYIDIIYEYVNHINTQLKS
jgi:hypothetical protein